jgi:hypothetical protein
LCLATIFLPVAIAKDNTTCGGEGSERLLILRSYYASRGILFPPPITYGDHTVKLLRSDSDSERLLVLQRPLW